MCTQRGYAAAGARQRRHHASVGMTRTSDFTELAMKQASCARWWCIASCVAAIRRLAPWKRHARAQHHLGDRRADPWPRCAIVPVASSHRRRRRSPASRRSTGTRACGTTRAPRRTPPRDRPPPRRTGARAPRAATTIRRPRRRRRSASGARADTSGRQTQHRRATTRSLLCAPSFASLRLPRRSYDATRRLPASIAFAVRFAHERRRAVPRRSLPRSTKCGG